MDPGWHNPTRVSLELFGPDQPPESTQVVGSRLAVLVPIASERLRSSILAPRPGPVARRHRIAHWLALAG